MNLNTIKKIDHVLDYIPVISTGSNLVNIIAKMVFGTINQESINNFSYFVHLSQKSYPRCITLLIPILGNVAILLYDTMNSAPELEDMHNQQTDIHDVQHDIQNRENAQKDTNIDNQQCDIQNFYNEQLQINNR